MSKDELTLGRALGNDVRLDDPFVSRRHAVIRRTNGHFTIEDAQSRAGVLVNDAPVRESLSLRSGDRIRLGSVERELWDPDGDIAGSGDLTATFPALDAPRRQQSAPTQQAPAAARPGVPVTPRPYFDVHGQYGGSISNIAGNQYNTALRLEPMRRRARRVLRIGFALFVLGVAIAAVGWASWAGPILNCIRSSNADLNPSSCINAHAFFTFAAGGLVSVVGLMTIIVSLFMRRSVGRKEAGR